MWERALHAEEARCRRFGRAAAVVLVELGPAVARGGEGGDALLRRAADTVTATTRDHDVVAWLGRVRVGVLAVECDEAALPVLVDRLRAALAGAGIDAEVGGTVRRPPGTLADAWAATAAAMRSRHTA